MSRLNGIVRLSLLGFLLLPVGTLGNAGAVEPGEEIITAVHAMGIKPAKTAPPRGDESKGPFERLVIKNGMVIDGTGAPPQGPLTLVIEGNRIVEMRGAGTGSLHASEEDFGPGAHVIDASGKFILPGLIDSHIHFGAPIHAFGGALTDPEYVGKLMLAHGITTVRDAGSLMGLDWTLEHKRRSAQGDITAPRIEAYALFPEQMASADAARKWIRAVHKRGADGVKLLGASPVAVEAAISEAVKLGMRTAYHHSQVSVTRINVLDSARLGLTSVEHWYGIPEVMFEEQTVQDYPYDYNYNDEQDRFAQAGRLWLQAAPPGSETWRRTIDELVELDLTLVPTFSAYEANRDVSRHRTLEWHADYTMPYMTRAFEPNPHIHGSFHFDWTTADEVAWRDNYRRWMTFVNDYKNAGGRVAAGADSGFIYNVYGFSYVRELEMLQEAGFHPLEVLQAATLNGAELLGMDANIGTVEVGKRADLVIVNENPLSNLKVLYGTGHLRLDRNTGSMGRTRGIQYTIKDGIVYDARHLLEDVRSLVAQRKQLEAETAAQRANMPASGLSHPESIH